MHANHSPRTVFVKKALGERKRAKQKRLSGCIEPLKHYRITKRPQIHIQLMTGWTKIAAGIGKVTEQHIACLLQPKLSICRNRVIWAVEHPQRKPLVHGRRQIRVKPARQLRQSPRRSAVEHLTPRISRSLVRTTWTEVHGVRTHIVLNQLEGCLLPTTV